MRGLLLILLLISLPQPLAQAGCDADEVTSLEQVGSALRPKWKSEFSAGIRELSHEIDTFHWTVGQPMQAPDSSTLAPQDPRPRDYLKANLAAFEPPLREGTN